MIDSKIKQIKRGNSEISMILHGGYSMDHRL